MSIDGDGYESTCSNVGNDIFFELIKPRFFKRGFIYYSALHSAPSGLSVAVEQEAPSAAGIVPSSFIVLSLS
jgi:hypothetical protein